MQDLWQKLLICGILWDCALLSPEKKKKSNDQGEHLNYKHTNIAQLGETWFKLNTWQFCIYDHIMERSRTDKTIGTLTRITVLEPIPHSATQVAQGLELTFHIT